MGATLSEPVKEKVRWRSGRMGFAKPLAAHDADLRTTPSLSDRSAVLHAHSLNYFAVQEVEEQEDENYDVGAVAMQGWRTEMVSMQTAQGITFK